MLLVVPGIRHKRQWGGERDGRKGRDKGMARAREWPSNKEYIHPLGMAYLAVPTSGPGGGMWAKKMFVV